MTTLRLFVSGALVASLLGGTAFPQETGGSRSFSVSKGGTLSVRLSTGSIAVQTWDKSNVEIANRTGAADLRQWNVEQKGGDISITDDRSEGTGDEDLAVRVPREYNVDLRTSAGDINMQGTLNGDFRAQTSGGDIQLGDVGKRLDVATAGGIITVGDIGGDGKIVSSGGDIRVRNVGRTLDASTAGGNVAVGDVGGDTRINSSGGDIRAGKVTGRVQLTTAGGDIELRTATGAVQLATSGGNLTAQEVTGSIEASTAGGDVRATLIPSGKGRSHLTSSGGDITLTLPANARVTIDAVIQLYGQEADEEGYQIRSDFPAERQDQRDNRHLIHARYLLNGGGEEIGLQTVNSNIYIKKLAR